MFDGTLQDLINKRRDFENNVQDKFGRSICSDIFAEMESCEKQLCSISNEADMEENRIRSVLEELRSIV